MELSKEESKPDAKEVGKLNADLLEFLSNEFQSTFQNEIYYCDILSSLISLYQKLFNPQLKDAQKAKIREEIKLWEIKQRVWKLGLELELKKNEILRAQEHFERTKENETSNTEDLKVENPKLEEPDVPTT